MKKAFISSQRSLPAYTLLATTNEGTIWLQPIHASFRQIYCVINLSMLLFPFSLIASDEDETFFMTFCLLIRFRNIFIVNLAISGNVSSALFIFHFTVNCAIVRSLGIREISLISCERFSKSLPRAGGKLKPGTRKNDKTYIRPQASQFSVFHAGGKAAHNDFVN